MDKDLREFIYLSHGLNCLTDIVNESLSRQLSKKRPPPLIQQALERFYLMPTKQQRRLKNDRQGNTRTILKRKNTS